MRYQHYTTYVDGDHYLTPMGSITVKLEPFFFLFMLMKQILRIKDEHNKTMRPSNQKSESISRERGESLRKQLYFYSYVMNDKCQAG